MRLFSFLLFAVLFCAFATSIGESVYAADGLPEPEKFWLPLEETPEDTLDAASDILAEILKYVGILAILAVSYGGVLMILSYGDESKLKNARMVIAYALIGVLSSASAYFLVNLVNNIRL